MNRFQVTVQADEIQQSVENLAYYIINDQNLNENVEIDENAIASPVD